jgi:hypothetical protein
MTSHRAVTHSGAACLPDLVPAISANAFSTGGGATRERRSRRPSAGSLTSDPTNRVETNPQRMAIAYTGLLPKMSTVTVVPRRRFPRPMWCRRLL